MLPSACSLPSLNSADSLLDLFLETRAHSEKICLPLTTEDHVVQAMTDVSPPKWHLGHTTWFFEEFILKPYLSGYQEFHQQYNFIFNSYYKAKGRHIPRSQRGLLARPPLKEVMQYRKCVTNAIIDLWENTALNPSRQKYRKLLVLGVQHEKQHQELMLTDIKYNFYSNPLCPAYHSDFRIVDKEHSVKASEPLQFLHYDGGSLEYFGHNHGKNEEGGDEFCYDNEMPRHKVYLHEFSISKRLITCKEYLDFIEDKGYKNFRYWFSDAWDTIQKEKWEAPLYWRKQDTQWEVFTLSGFRPLNKSAAVCHISYYEADAYAKWAGKRLPTEFEWEYAAKKAKEGLMDVDQVMGQAWQWTSSPYLPYPGFQAPKGALAEYNGKFMSNQMVLRGGSCYSPDGHLRPTYRNFLQPEKRWQLTGLRLASQ